jgi:hypothetical protein
VKCPGLTCGDILRHASFWRVHGVHHLVHGCCLHHHWLVLHNTIGTEAEGLCREAADRELHGQRDSTQLADSRLIQTSYLRAQPICREHRQHHLGAVFVLFRQEVLRRTTTHELDLRLCWRLHLWYVANRDRTKASREPRDLDHVLAYRVMKGGSFDAN